MPRGRLVAMPRGWSVPSFLVRVLITTATWIVLTTGSTRSPVLAAIVIVAVALWGLAAIPPGTVRLSAGGLIRFLPLFIDYSVRGGIGVARLAFFRPRVPTAGTFIFVTTLPPEIPRYVFVAVLGLVPGTIVVAVDGDRITIHALERGPEVEERLRTFEQRVRAVFRE